MISNNQLTQVEQEQFNQLVNEFLDSNFRKLLEKIKQETPRGMKVPSCFISYAWGSGFEDKVETLAQYLLAAGVNALFDLNDNKPGTSISGFFRQIDNVDYVILIGTKNLMEKCNKDNYKRAYSAEFYEAQFPMHVNFPVVSREMVHIRKRLKDFLTAHQFHTSTFLIPICLEGEYPRIFSHRLLKDIAGFQWQNWPNYPEIFNLLMQLLPDTKVKITSFKKEFEKLLLVKSPQFTNNPNNIAFLKQQIASFGDIKDEQAKKWNQHIQDKIVEYLKNLGINPESQTSPNDNNASVTNSITYSQANLVTQHTTIHSETKKPLSNRALQFEQESSSLTNKLKDWGIIAKLEAKGEELVIELEVKNTSEDQAKNWLEECRALIEKIFPKIISTAKIEDDAFFQTLIIQSKRAQQLCEHLSTTQMFQLSNQPPIPHT